MTLNAVDVAQYIVEKMGEMPASELHELLYLSQAWHLAWEGEPLFDDPIELWEDRPVVPTVHRYHEGSSKVDSHMFHV